MTPRSRRLRYGAPLVVVLLGIIWAAVDTTRLGNTAGTVLIGAGLIGFMIVVGRDLGMGERTGRRAKVPPPPAERRNGSQPDEVSPSK